MCLGGKDNLHQFSQVFEILKVTKNIYHTRWATNVQSVNRSQKSPSKSYEVLCRFQACIKGINHNVSKCDSLITISMVAVSKSCFSRILAYSGRTAAGYICIPTLLHHHHHHSPYTTILTTRTHLKIKNPRICVISNTTHHDPTQTNPTQPKTTHNTQPNPNDKPQCVSGESGDASSKDVTSEPQAPSDAAT